MKKFLLIATVAGVALAGCAKNEKAFDADSQSKIQFSAPVMSLPTKGLITGTRFPIPADFVVTGWHTPGAFQANGAGTTLYMDEAVATYNDGDNLNPDEPENGAWVTDTDYYWPMTGKLTFSAVSPSSVADKLTFNATTGFTITDYVVDADADTDLLYSKRSFNNEKGTYVAGNTYEGVDLAFYHALSAVIFKAKAVDQAAADAFKITNIEVRNVGSTATFAEGLENGTETDSNVSSEWTTPTDATNYRHFTGSQTLTTAAVDVGEASIFIPQALSGTDNVQVVITYTQETDSDPITHQKIVDLGGLTNANNATETISEWKKSTKYIYTLVFSVDKIYFAPAIADDWTGVTIADSNI